MFKDPTVIAAIVAAITSLIVSVTSGFYTVFQNKKRFEILKRETLIKSDAARYDIAKAEYFSAFRQFEYKINLVNEKNPNDGTKAIQVAVDFLADTARDFYLRYKPFLQTKELDEMLNKINLSIASKKLNEPDNHDGKREFGYDIINFCSKLHERALESYSV